MMTNTMMFESHVAMVTEQASVRHLKKCLFVKINEPKHFITKARNVFLEIMSIVTLRAESPSIFLEKSGRGRRLCSRPAQFLLSMLQNQM